METCRTHYSQGDGIDAVNLGLAVNMFIVALPVSVLRAICDCTRSDHQNSRKDRTSANETVCFVLT
jgi:hypothetical protein